MTSGRSLNGIAAAVVVALTGVTLGLDAQVTNLRIEPVAPTVPPPAACLAPSRPSLDNGIGVGDPKVFDNRSLALMLDTLNESLRNLHVVDSKSLTTNLGVLQGYQQDSVARSFSLQGAPLSGVTETAKATQQASTGSEQVANATTAANPANATTAVTNKDTATTATSEESSTQTTTASRSPVTPELPQLLNAPSFSPQFGQSAGDLLNDQVNLTYQIFNVRMLLERALTDRLIGSSPRLQAVLGFNVSIDPPRDSQDSAAFVEVTVQRRDGAALPVSVVALMPQEKTYNSAALSNRSTAFGGSAVSSLISLGYNERRQSQTFYLFRDNDTISFERTAAGSTQTRFGWAFRPVLGRRSVSPGMRQMFAVISLPNDDTTNTEVALSVHARTYWRHYDRRTLTTADSRTFWQRVGRVASLALWQDRPQSNQAVTMSCVMVPTTLKFTQDLGPSVADLSWKLADSSTAVVTVRGNNFFRGTAIRLGGKTYGAAGDGLVLKSDKALDLVVPVGELLGNGMILGRYGNAVELVDPAADPVGVRIQQAEFRPPIGGRRQVLITLQKRNVLQSLATSDLHTPAVVSLNGVVIPPPYDVEITSPSGGGPTTVLLRAYPPVDQFPTTEGLLTVRFPFLGDQWQSTFAAYDPDLTFTVTRFAAEESTTRFLVSTTDVRGNPFRAPCPALSTRELWTVKLGSTYVVQPNLPPAPQDGAGVASTRYLEIRARNGELDKHPLLLTNCEGVTFRLPVPPSPRPAPPDPTILTRVVPAVVRPNSAPKVTIAGAELGRVTSMTANGTRLASRVVEKALEVFLERSITKDVGPVALVARDKEGTILGSIEISIENPK